MADIYSMITSFNTQDIMHIISLFGKNAFPRLMIAVVSLAVIENVAFVGLIISHVAKSLVGDDCRRFTCCSWLIVQGIIRNLRRIVRHQHHSYSLRQLASVRY
ncbi:hypothetical protein [Domibacillus aminovorans]|uniref:hypothetical protein n=1 Tax=Domibacillus aminovorans TaxID=29332 RepID=UPI0012FD5269|nr:hypothetical protein [Domibacillus aminovorans]